MAYLTLLIMAPWELRDSIKSSINLGVSGMIASGSTLFNPLIFVNFFPILCLFIIYYIILDYNILNKLFEIRGFCNKNRWKILHSS